MHQRRKVETLTPANTCKVETCTCSKEQVVKGTSSRSDDPVDNSLKKKTYIIPRRKQRGTIVKVFAFIDTNVLLHYCFFLDVDWGAALDEPEVVLVLAPVVLSELDDHKWSGSRREKARAKGVLKAIDEIELADEAIGIRAGVSVMGIEHEPAEAMFARYRLQGSVKDDRLLASLLAFREERGSNDRVLLVTADAGLRVKARGQRIEVIAPADDLAIDDEPDETERRLSAANRELAAYKSAAPDLRLTIEGEPFIERKVHLVREFDTQTLARLFAEWRSRYRHVGGMPDQVQLPGLPRLPGSISAEDAEIALVFENYEKYLEAWPFIVNRYRRSLELKFVLENSGTAPADDVHLNLWTGADGVWLEELLDLPTPPAMPKRRDLLDFVLHRPMPDVDPGTFRVALRDSDGPNVSEAEPKCVKYWEKRVTHHVPRELSPVYFQFTADETVGSFSINYRLVAANIREPQKGTVHVKLSLGEAQAPPVPGSEAEE